MSLSQTSYEAITQSAGIFGMYGNILWVVMLNVLLFEYLESRREQQKYGRWVAIIVGVYLIPVIYGTVILRTLPGREGDISSLRAAIVQPNVDPNRQNSTEFRDQHFQNLISLSQRALLEHPDVIIWPETATPPFIHDNPDGYRTGLQEFVDTTNVPVLTGTVDWKPSKNGSNGYFYNAVVPLEPNEGVTELYRKIKLVPFAEYIPYPAIFGLLDNLELSPF